MSSNSTTDDETSLAALVAHEDLRLGDFVSILNEVCEFPSFFWFDGLTTPAEELVRVRYCSREAGRPLKIKAICLPFVHVKTPDGSTRIVDVRKVQLVRLQQRYAKVVWKARRKRGRKNKIKTSGR